jgi:hypothetical protein
MKTNRFGAAGTVVAMWMLAGCSTASSESSCMAHCEILADCGAIESSGAGECTSGCLDMLAGDCFGSCEELDVGGDPRACAEALLESNRRANGNECTSAFEDEWCDTYYEDPACSPLFIGGITCS